jgi:murein DD-endopeptidase MepM/ murein hydrolase activator NlpD
MKHLLVLLLCLSFVRGAHPLAFSSLGAELESGLTTLRALEGMPWIDRRELDRYAQVQQACFKKGYALDTALQSQTSGIGTLRSAYLACLRSVRRQGSRWAHRYESALQRAIGSDEKKEFALLVTHPLEPMYQPALQKAVLAYYETIRSERNISVMEQMREVAANTQYTEDDDSFVHDQTVLGEQEARNSRRRVVVTAKEQYGRYVFYAKNKNSFPVTLTLSLTRLKNLKAMAKLPCSIELGPNVKEKILDVDVVDRAQGASMQSRYSWVMGLASARHSDPLYRLPFAVGSEVTVSQGFNGGSTHVGRECNAVDFSCPVGTKVYAARGGRVIAVESSHRQGGYDKRYRADANYIIIEHDDHTFGRYFHLRHNGAVVRVGEIVRTGQMIGYSGNTGYTSGPHLHFCVTSVDPESKSAPTTLPFRFETSGGEVDAPKTGDIYRVVGMR